MIVIAVLSVTIIVNVILFCLFHKLDVFNKSTPNGTKVFKTIGHVVLFETAVYIAISFLPPFSVSLFVMTIIDAALLFTYFVLIMCALKHIKKECKLVENNNDYLIKKIGQPLFAHGISILFCFIFSVLIAAGFGLGYYVFDVVSICVSLLPSVAVEIVFMIWIGRTLKVFGK